jgi:2-polyprenyl-6-methoxyphenol hydroxylase-like FAD-dependent oxidoreductase
VPLSAKRMYMFATTPEDPNRRFERKGLAAEMRGRLSNAPPRISELAAEILDDDQVVYKPLECLFVDGPWHRGRIVLLGDAVHATTPHLGQGAGMAIEDSLVLAEELSKAATPEQAFTAYHARRFDRCRYVVERSRAIGDGQLGKGPLADTASESRKMFEITAQPI